MNRYLFLFFLFLILSACKSSADKGLPHQKKQDSLIVVINHSGDREREFKYFDLFGNSALEHILDNDTLRVRSKNSIAAYQMSRMDTSDLSYYELRPGDTINIEKEYRFSSTNKQLNGRIQLMEKLKFFPGSVLFLPGLDAIKSGAFIAATYSAKTKLIDQTKTLYDNLMVKDAVADTKYEYLANILAINTRYNIKNDPLLIVPNVDSTAWDHLPYRDYLITYINYLQKVYKVYDAYKFVGLIKKRVSAPARDHLLFLYLSKKQHPDERSLDTLDHLVKDYKGSSKVRVFSDYLESQMRLNILNDKNSRSADVILLNQNSARSTFKELIDRDKGKIIFVDFWASWCSPCLMEMPNSLRLSKELSKNGKKVVFIYLSIDKDLTSWNNKAKEIGLPGSNSFLMLQNKGSKELVDKFKLNTIPRYMIIDKNGNIVNNNAPRPNNPKLKKLLLL